jgi:hypothetical protein
MLEVFEEDWAKTDLAAREARDVKKEIKEEKKEEKRASKAAEVTEAAAGR